LLAPRRQKLLHLGRVANDQVVGARGEVALEVVIGAEMAAQVRRLFVAGDPAASVFRGCTTNPPPSLTAVQSDPKYWDPRIDEIIASHPGISPRELFWETYKAVIHKGAQMMLPM
jgi:hypothetical protein